MLLARPSARHVEVTACISDPCCAACRFSQGAPLHVRDELRLDDLLVPQLDSLESQLQDEQHNPQGTGAAAASEGTGCLHGQLQMYHHTGRFGGTCQLTKSAIIAASHFLGSPSR